MRMAARMATRTAVHMTVCETARVAAPMPMHDAVSPLQGTPSAMSGKVWRDRLGGMHRHSYSTPRSTIGAGSPS